MHSKLSYFITGTSIVGPPLWWRKCVLTGYLGRFKQRDAVELLEYMATEGDVEWEGVGRATVIVYWRKPEEWANAIYEWVIVSACFGGDGKVLTMEMERSIIQDKKEAYSHFTRYLKGISLGTKVPPPFACSPPQLTHNSSHRIPHNRPVCPPQSPRLSCQT